MSLGERHRGKGLATEAAGALLDDGFGELGMARIDGGAGPDNLASKRVMEKIGMRYLGQNRMVWAQAGDHGALRR